MITDQRKFTAKLTIYGMSSFHCYRSNQCKVFAYGNINSRGAAGFLSSAGAVEPGAALRAVSSQTIHNSSVPTVQQRLAL